MTEPSTSRPVPGPPSASGPAGQVVPPESSAPPERADGETRFADLDEQPVAEHVAVFEAEHDRLQRELGTIDRL
jgi:hypothetical protein